VIKMTREEYQQHVYDCSGKKKIKKKDYEYGNAEEIEAREDLFDVVYDIIGYHHQSDEVQEEMTLQFMDLIALCAEDIVQGHMTKQEALDLCKREATSWLNEQKAAGRVFDEKPKKPKKDYGGNPDDNIRLWKNLMADGTQAMIDMTMAGQTAIRLLDEAMDVAIWLEQHGVNTRHDFRRLFSSFDDVLDVLLDQVRNLKRMRI
jgi:hypothetical protein